jgi:hypothetical protein
MAEVEKTVFISYRREISSFTARSVFQDLQRSGYDVFMDVESLDSGRFETVILNQIAERAYFLVILEPGSVDRCSEKGDWLRREIERALELDRNIVPLLAKGFTFEAHGKGLTGRVGHLAQLNGVTVFSEYFDSAMRSQSHARPADGGIAAVLSEPLDDHRLGRSRALSSRSVSVELAKPILRLSS